MILFYKLSLLLVSFWTVLQIAFNSKEYKDYKFIPLSPYSLLLGYGDKPIIVNMLKTPHLLFTGLSLQGKSRCLKVVLKNLRGADIILCNAFWEDFKDINFRKCLYTEQEMLKYISFLVDKKEKMKRPLYVVLEELGTIKNKILLQKIQELLLVGRHYNIFVIGVIQIATKEDLKFKSYFNVRCSFKQLDDSAYRVVLSTAPSDLLQSREFYLLSDNLYKGKTYNIK